MYRINPTSSAFQCPTSWPFFTFSHPVINQLLVPSLLCRSSPYLKPGFIPSYSRRLLLLRDQVPQYLTTFCVCIPTDRFFSNSLWHLVQWFLTQVWGILRVEAVLRHTEGGSIPPPPISTLLLLFDLLRFYLRFPLKLFFFWHYHLWTVFLLFSSSSVCIFCFQLGCKLLEDRDLILNFFVSPLLSCSRNIYC